MTRRGQSIGTGEESTADRFARLARERRTQDLRQLVQLGALVGGIGALVHALQKERGTVSIYLGSGGQQFSIAMQERAADSAALDMQVREYLEQFGGPDASLGARFYHSAAQALTAMSTMPARRAAIADRSIPADGAIRGFSDVIAQLLAVSMEAADLAADPVTSRAIVALTALAHGKEYAGQERAIAGAALSRGDPRADEHARLRRLVADQDHAFTVFREFGGTQAVTGFDELAGSASWSAVLAMRATLAAAAGLGGGGPLPSATLWYEATTLRIDGLKRIEEQINADLEAACTQAMSGTPGMPETLLAGEGGRNVMRAVASISLLVANAGSGIPPQPVRSVLDVLDTQSRHIEDISSQLDQARNALAERKFIERAKGLLMKAHKLSENDAYAVMREMAMRQNRRLAEVAQAVLGMAERGG